MGGHQRGRTVRVDELACLGRVDLAVEWIERIDGFDPVAVFGDVIVLGGEAEIRGFSLSERRVLWHCAAEAWRPGTGGPMIREESSWVEVDPRTGRSRRRLRLPGMPALFEGDLILCASESAIGEFASFDAREGRTLWARDLLMDAQIEGGGLEVCNGTTPGQFVATNHTAGQTMAFSLENGELLWKVGVSVPYYRPLVANGRIPILTLSLRGNDYVLLDERTGGVLVNRHEEGLAGMIHQQTGSMWGASRVVFTSESGHIAAFDLESGELIALERTNSTLWGSTIVDNRLLVPSAMGELLVYEMT